MPDSNVTTSTEQDTNGEQIRMPRLILRPQTADEEFEYLWAVLGKAPFYIKHGYSFETPDHPVFKELVQRAPNFEGVNREAMQELFVDEVYDPNFFQAGTLALENERGLIESAFPEMVKLNTKWGFKLFPKYIVSLTRYGPGGSYDPENGVIVVLPKEDGTFEEGKLVTHTVIHEMVHLGIEHIVNGFKLTHAEKERLVDLITLSKFGHLLLGYRLQPMGDSRIDSYINDETLEDLPIAVEKYVQDFPRK